MAEYFKEDGEHRVFRFEGQCTQHRSASGATRGGSVRATDQQRAARTLEHETRAGIMIQALSAVQRADGSQARSDPAGHRYADHASAQLKKSLTRPSSKRGRTSRRSTTSMTISATTGTTESGVWLTTRGFRQLYFRPSVRYRARPWFLLHGGAAWFHTSIDGADNVNELRPWIGLRFLGPRPGGFVFSNYFRVEHRAFKGGILRDWETLGRARYQLQVTSPRFKIGRSEGFYALAFAELFKNFGSSVEGLFLAQSRFDVGVGKQINRGCDSSSTTCSRR